MAIGPPFRSHGFNSILVKRIDYLRLITTGRKSGHYFRPSDTDGALTRFIGYGFVASLIFTFVAAVLASFLGNELDMIAVGKPLAATAILGIAFFVGCLFVGRAARLVRYYMIAVSVFSMIALPMLAMAGSLEIWYVYVPTGLYSFLVGLSTAEQMWKF